MRPLILPLAVCAAVSCLSAPAASASSDQPEIKRAVAAPQQDGVLHTLRTIPEACSRIQGQFTGNAAKPYDFAIVQTSPRCQPRAKLVDAADVQPKGKPGWVYLDQVQVPSASCPGRQAVVRIWRHDTRAQPPKLDAQGKSRIYLKDSMDTVRAGQQAEIPSYAVEMGVAGKACR